jgi:hypothetical protein
MSSRYTNRVVSAAQLLTLHNHLEMTAKPTGDDGENLHRLIQE